MKVCSIVVCFHPDVVRLVALCESLRRHGSEVVIVDNTVDRDRISQDAVPGCRIHSAGLNLGIAAAQNIGIGIALSFGSDVLVFFDQDSRIGESFLTDLLAPLSSAEAPVSLAPAYVDERLGYEYPSLLLSPWGFPKKVYARQATTPFPVDVTISSGSAITAAALRVAGTMDEAFFIDYVDTEWCLRARQRGVSIKIVPTARMQHSIGNGSIDAGVLRAQIHAPIRSYFKTRNSLLLFRRRPRVPTAFAIREILVLFIHHAVTVACSPQRATHAAEILRGLRDGVLGRFGARSVV